ncbi:MAG: dihydrodipicolinate synthase family protein [Phycisphaerae bacterium]|nr:dihydrodipicolinate synthase family protein [Phycisphaerae bacterium]
MTDHTSRHQFRGIIPPVLTPFTQSGKLDEPALAAVLDWFCHRPVNGLFLTGGLGEWRHLEWAERERVMRVAAEVVDGRLPIVPHIGGCNDIENIVKLGKVAAKLRVHAAALIIPEDIPEGPEPIHDHIAAVARDVELPLALYDTQGRGPRSVTPDLMRRILDDNIQVVAMKYRAMQGDDMLAMVEAAGDRVNVLAGAETVFLPALAVGAVGVIGGGCNIYPSILAGIQRDYDAGRHDEAIEGQREVNRLLAASSRVSWPLAGKIIWQAWGLPVQPITRATCRDCSPEAIREVQKIFGPMQHIAG